jgi:membrane protein required for colicin V production
MNFFWIDFIVVLFILRGIVIGYRRGFSGEALRFLGVFFGIILAFKYYESLSVKLESLDLGPRAAMALSFIGIFLVVIMFFYMANRMMRHLMQLPLVAVLEKGGGAVFGGLKSFIIALVVLIVLALVKIDWISNAVSSESYFGSLAIRSVPGAYNFVVKIYPDFKSESAEQAIEKLPAVRSRTEFDFLEKGGREGGQAGESKEGEI